MIAAGKAGGQTDACIVETEVDRTMGEGKRSVLATAVLLTALLPLSGAEDTAKSKSALIAVRADEELGPVNRLVFGHNLEAADSLFIFGPDSNPIPGRTGDGVWDPSIPPGEPVAQTVEVAQELDVGMLRYPGGCLVHNFDWKKAVGPLEDRPDFTFGIDEFITYCRAVGAEPLMTVSAYVGGPVEAAELVEYLNAEVGPDHPWAQLRAAGGHPEPYGVRYFEMGNESDHGNHDVVPHLRFSAEEYGEWFNQCSLLMRDVDPDIEMGALMGTGTGPFDPWNQVVLASTGDTADFIIVHTYSVGYWGQGGIPGDRLMRACMAVGEQFENYLVEYRAEILTHSGRAKPLAITEYNGGFVQEDPVPYRFSLGAALFAADWVRTLLEPEANCLMANYWHFVNGYWGLLRGPRVAGEPPEEWTEMAACPLFRLWGSHFGTRLLEVEAEGPRLEFEGAAGVAPATDPPLPAAEVEPGWLANSGAGPGWSWRVTGTDSMEMDLNGFQSEAYSAFAEAEVVGGRTYTLAFEARLVGDLPPGAALGLGLVDSRGWDATESGCGADGIGLIDGWADLECSVNTLLDAQDLVVLWRLVNGGDPVTALVEVRDLTLSAAPTNPPYAALTASASLSDDGRRLYLMVINKHHEEAISASIDIAGFNPVAALYWEVTGPSLEATNLQAPLVVETVSGSPVAELGASGFAHTFPAHSMTAFEIDAEMVREASGRQRP